MSPNHRLRWVVMALLVLLLAACTLSPAPATPTVSLPTMVSATLTAVAQGGNLPTPAATASSSPSSTPTPTFTPTPAVGDIVGLLWQDQCQPQGGENGEPLAPGPGCKEYPDLGIGADGERQPDEPGLEGAQVSLARGACPDAQPLSVTVTGAQGRFAFPKLAPGEYCLTIDPLAPPNQDRFIPGVWTAPEPRAEAEPLQQTVQVVAGQATEVAFGWYPTAHGFVGKQCLERMALVSETVEDGTEVVPGKPFPKAWVLRNTGDCPWTTKFALVHTDGPLMGAPERVFLPHDVPPGGEVTVEVQFTAPDAPGTYHSVWRMEDPQGHRFGLGEQGKGEIWVEVVVPQHTEQISPPAPTVRDTMDSTARWYLVDNAQAQFAPGAGVLTLRALQAGTSDTWGLSSYPALGDAYLEGVFKTGASCAGKDRYGLIVRAPQPSQGVVVTFSCDGAYRAYLWDGAHYHGLREWTPAGAIHAGPHQTNRLGVWMKGDTIKIYANRILVGVVHESQYLQGGFGLVVGAEQTPGFSVDVDEVDYWTSPP